MSNVRNLWYPGGLAAIGRGDVVLTTDALLLVALDSTFVYDAADTTLADIPSGQRIGSPGALAGTRSMVGPYLATDTAVSTIGSVPTDANDMTGVLLCTDGASDASRTLLHVWQSQGDTSLIDVVTDGGDVEVEFFTVAALANPALFWIVKI